MANKIYGGSEISRNGGLTGATDTDYFYFFCPKCPDKHIMRILSYDIRVNEKGNTYNSELTKKAQNSFVIAFSLFCEKCKHEDVTKVSNIGWQGGTHAQALRAIGAM